MVNALNVSLISHHFVGIFILIPDADHESEILSVSVSSLNNSGDFTVPVVSLANNTC